MSGPTDGLSLRDEIVVDLLRPASLGLDDSLGLAGFGTVELFDTVTGRVRMRQTFRNLVTDAGDLYCAQKLIQGISPASPAAPSGAATMGMKLGSGTTAAAKNSTGSALITYLTASNRALDATYPQTSNLGAGAGVVAVWKCTWSTGTTITNIGEAVIVNDATTDATSASGATFARTVFSTFTKATTDAMTITWNWKQLGA